MDDTPEMSVAATNDYTALTANLVCAYVSNNSIPASELATLIDTLHGAFAELTTSGGARTVVQATPVQIWKSITHAGLISFEDGKPYKTLGRHLRKLGLDPDTYRAKWGLPRDYPMVAAGYSEMRSALAKSAGLGHQRREVSRQVAQASVNEAEGQVVKPKRAGRLRYKVRADAAVLGQR